jgi:N-acetylglucosaminyldiphosphoundecaprenol N-acetyl-beta-D-mannosaminyltransferase
MTPVSDPGGVMILGVRVDDVTQQEALDLLARWVQAGTLHQVATVNVEFIMEARKNPAFRQVLAEASLCVPDGVGVLWAARRSGRALRERVPGVDLVESISERAAAAGWRVFYLGAAPGVAEKASRILKDRYPDLQVAGYHAGSPHPRHDDELVERIRAARADVLLVAYGAPKQDLWIARNQHRIGVPVALGVGGSFDFVAGKTRRAPRWVQRLGLEWFYRLLQEPWRLRRQLVIPRFMWLVIAGRI